MLQTAHGGGDPGFQKQPTPKLRAQKPTWPRAGAFRLTALLWGVGWGVVRFVVEKLGRVRLTCHWSVSKDKPSPL